MNRLSYQGRMNPQMQRIVERQKAQAQNYPDLDRQSPERIRQLYAEERRFWNAQAPPLQKIRNHVLKTDRRDIPIRIYYPDVANGSFPIIFLHGGGWVVGDLDTHDRITRLLAIDSGYPVVSVDYALAPTHQFPVAINEVLYVVRLLRKHAERYALNATRIAMAGDSAGANMCAACGALLQRESPGLISKLALYYGGYGLQDSVSRRLYGTQEDGLRPEDLAYYQQSYLGDLRNADDPRYAVLNADLRYFPPAFIAAAGLDPLRDDSAALSAMLEGHGVEHEYMVYPGVLHGFLHMSRMLDSAREAITAGAQSISQAFA